jgi:hypothetical protein
VMKIDPSESTTSFASITDVSCYKHIEDEVIFSMHTIFRTHDIKPMNDNERLFQVELTLNSDDDKIFVYLLNTLEKKLKDQADGID